MPTYHHANFDLIIEPEQGWFSVISHHHSIRLEQIHLSIACTASSGRFNLLEKDWLPRSITESQVETALGRLHRCSIESNAHAVGLQTRLEFAFADHLPFLFWRVNLHNQAEQAVWIDRIELMRVGGMQPHSRIDFGRPFNPQDFWFYSNGWQSWSYTAAYPATASLRQSRLGAFQKPMVINAGTPDHKQHGYFTSDFFGILTDARQQKAVLAGFLSQREQFGTLEAVLYDRPVLRLWANGDHTLLESGKQMLTDWAVLLIGEANEENLLHPYLKAVAEEHQVSIPQESPSGWCSWYHFYTHVTAQNIRDNLKTLVELKSSLPLNLIQIDDGFESQVGDWFSFKETFPQGVAGLAEEISRAGFTPGLWLAPFIVHPKSQLEKEHPEWLLCDRRGRPVNAGFVWNAFTHALDLTIPEALEYACQVIQTAAHEWKFPYLKLDFLYAAALPGAYRNPSRTRAQVLRQGMEALRRAAGEQTFLLGCGAPLGSVVGLVDAMRIGADVSGDWQPAFYNIRFPFKNEPHMPSARNSINNILTRSPLHRQWWINDPDCLLVRPDTRLTLAEVQSLATAISLTGGSLLLSDDLPALPAERIRLAQVLLPVIGKPARVLDLLTSQMPALLRTDLEGAIGKWHLIARFNWEEKSQEWEFEPRTFLLPETGYYLHSFWDDQSFFYQPGNTLHLPAIPPHGVALLAVYPQTTDIAYGGSNLHISQGLEVRQWMREDQEVELTLDLAHSFEGWFDLLVNRPPRSIIGNIARWQEKDKGCVRFFVKSDGIPCKAKILFG
ncbi:MAG: glycoside hydrolase family 36 protein [Chloroflexota bacterium]